MGVQKRVIRLKEEMRDRFGAAHALKSPPHITLQMPFRRDPSRESDLVAGLERFAKAEKRFDISLSGFDCFSPRVIFIKVVQHEPIKALHHRLNLALKNELHFAEKELRQNIHPHMTIATRDLSPDNFANAWQEFRQRPFDDAFTAKGITLLKHNGKFWDVLKDFAFQAKA